MKYQTFDMDFRPRGIVDATHAKEALALARKNDNTRVAPSVQPYDIWLATRDIVRQIEYQGYGERIRVH